MDILLFDETEKTKKMLGDNIAYAIENHPVSSFECRRDSYLISLNRLDVGNLEKGSSRIVIFFSRKEKCFLCSGREEAEQIRAAVADQPSDESALYAFFADAIKDDMEKLEAFEDRITEFEEKLLTGGHRASAGDLIMFRRQVRAIKKYYDELDKITEGLAANESALISEDCIRYFQILEGRVDRILGYAQNQRDYVTQIREAYQAQIDIEQNNLMKIFTVVATIFLPLTLVVGWYGMNFSMPEFAWKHGYLFVSLLCIAVVAGCIIFFRKKKWF